VKKLHIFKSGTHTASCGTSLQFDEAALLASAAAYDPELHEAPLVVGHPSDNGPAYGWVQGLSFSDGQLDAEPHQVNPDFEELVQSGAYKKLSASFYSPDSPTNPVPGTWYLRHVGFLGAQPPAIKGLKAIGFSESEPGIVEFSSADTNNWATADFMRKLREWMIGKFGKEDADEVVPGYMVEGMETAARQPDPDPEPKQALEPSPAFSEPDPKGPNMTPEELAAAQAKLDAAQANIDSQAAQFAEREAKLADAEQALAMAGIKDSIDNLVTTGQILPGEVDRLASFMGGLGKDHVVEFSEDGKDAKVGASEYLLGLFAAMPARVEFSEQSKGKLVGDLSSKDMSTRGELYRNEMAAKGIRLNYTEAINAVVAGKDLA
jgi:hypothetical protein